MHKMWRLNEAGPADGRVSPGATLDQVVDRMISILKQAAGSEASR